MSLLFKKHILLWQKKSFLIDVLFGILCIIASFVILYYANAYTFTHASNAVTDLLLDHLPVVNVDIIYSDGAVVFLCIMLIAVLLNPEKIPFTLRAVALFIMIRSGFMLMTHLAPPLHESYLDTSDLIHKVSSGDDLFFSGHTGLPYLMALIFWKQRPWRWFFLICSIVGATAVLLGHLHYSIDVFSAFFITFGIYHIAQWVFSSNYTLEKSYE